MGRQGKKQSSYKYSSLLTIISEIAIIIILLFLIFNK